MQGLGTGVWPGVPRNARIKLRVHPQSDAVGFGLRLRASEFDTGYDLYFAPYEKVVRLNDQWLYGVEGLNASFDLEIVLNAEILDVCVDNRRTVIDRCLEQWGYQIFFYGQDSSVTFEILEMVKIFP